MDKVWSKIKKSWEEQPLQTALVGSLVVTATAKLIDALANARGRSTWAREVARRDRMSR